MQPTTAQQDTNQPWHGRTNFRREPSLEPIQLPGYCVRSGRNSQSIFGLWWVPI